MSESRYVVGIDLGTTHSALAWIDTREVDDPVARVLPVPQFVAQGSIASRGLLPSFLYQAHEAEAPFVLPWTEERRLTAGEYARARGHDAPTRVIASAKSWLCHPTIDRRSPVLPAQAPEGVERISPVEASFRYLEHLAGAFDAWMAVHDPGQRLADQDVVVTVPASFDAQARELTVEAAYAAGIERLTLLEEPQAALYAWTLARGDRWRKEIAVGSLILVIDVGGGTTDFSAIRVEDREGSVGLERLAVGDHILLGGDNMDLLLARLTSARLERENKPVDAWQAAALVFACRVAKEKLLSGEVAAAPIALASRGAKLVGGTLRTELERADVESVIVQGFFPAVAVSEGPAARARSALTQVGLPYAQETGITRHLARFLTKHAAAAGGAGVLPATHVLFNGGVMKSDELRRRTMDILAGWLTAEGRPAPRTLEGSDPDLAVAKGAAWYGLVRRGRGLRIRGGTARAYYVGIERAAPAIPGLEPPLSLLCVAPFGMEEGTGAAIGAVGPELGVVVGESVDFRFFASSVRRDDLAGTDAGEIPLPDVEELSPIRVTLPATLRKEGDVVPVRLASRVTETGVLELEAVPTRPLADAERWKIELGVRGA